MTKRRIFLTPSDLMLLEGFQSKNTAYRRYKLILCSIGKPESAKLTIEDYAKDALVNIEQVYAQIPEVPFPFKYFKDRA